MRKIPMFILGLIFVFTIRLNPALAQTVTPTPASTVVPTNVASTITPTPVVLPVPQGISAVMISDDRIDVSWKSSTGASSYEVYRNDELVAIVSSLFYSDNGLDAETSYSYKVRAYDGSNYSSYSTNVSATTRSTSAQGTPEPTIPLGPDDNKLKPSVQETYSYVTVGSVKYGYNEVTAFDSGEEFIILGRTEEYADVEIVVASDPTSYFAKADDDGFWEVSVNTGILEEGDHTFKIIISTSDFPEKYESEEYKFEINPKTEPTVAPVTESTFGSRLNRIILVVIVLVVLLFIILIVVAVKKGWFKKFKSTTPQGDGSTQGENMELNNLIQLDHEGESAPLDTSVSQGTINNTAIPTTSIPVVETSSTTEQVQAEKGEQTAPSQAEAMLNQTQPVTTEESPQEIVETSEEEVVVQDKQPEIVSSALSEEDSTMVGSESTGRVDSDDSEVTEMTIDTEDESKDGLNIEEVASIPNEVDTAMSDTDSVVDTKDVGSTEPLEDQVVRENAEEIPTLQEETTPEVIADVNTPSNDEALPSFSTSETDEVTMGTDDSSAKIDNEIENDYSSTTPAEKDESIQEDIVDDDEMVTRDGLYTGSQESVPNVVAEETPASEPEQEIDENPNDVNGL